MIEPRPSHNCPFGANDPDRTAIWNMLVQRDIDAFAAADWSMVADDFIADGFFGIDGHRDSDVAQWQPAFSSLSTYREEWLRQATVTQATADARFVREDLFALTNLSTITFNGDFATAQKTFNGAVRQSSGAIDELCWQTLYLCRKVDGRWRIRGFIGYMPYSPPGHERDHGAKQPIVSQQHVTAGPYSPVLRVMHDAELVVVSGQAPLDLHGAVVGETIEEQARVTLENCRSQLAAAGLDLRDVFKVNVYLTDLSAWDRFNQIYREVMPEPYPVRTAIGCALLPGFLVEIELWAARR